jgi:hypothetical protein
VRYETIRHHTYGKVKKKAWLELVHAQYASERKSELASNLETMNDMPFKRDGFYQKQ